MRGGLNRSLSGAEGRYLASAAAISRSLRLSFDFAQDSALREREIGMPCYAFKIR
jgi:hypothetical protein